MPDTPNHDVRVVARLLIKGREAPPGLNRYSAEYYRAVCPTPEVSRRAIDFALGLADRFAPVVTIESVSELAIGISAPLSWFENLFKAKLRAVNDCWDWTTPPVAPPDMPEWCELFGGLALPVAVDAN